MSFECQCANCKSACERKPGWFMPGEAEALAERMGITLQELFDKHLMVDWWEGDKPIFVLSPAIVGHEPGEEFPGDPSGRCVFFKRGKCTIHKKGKPFECATLDHEEGSSDRHRSVAMAWKKPKYQKLIRTLLGRKPYARSPRLFGGMGSLIGSILGWTS